jgi:hypothetical protein
LGHQRERRTAKSLSPRAQIVLTIGDTARTAASRRIGSREPKLIESLLRELLSVEDKLPYGVRLAHFDGIELTPFGEPELC